MQAKLDEVKVELKNMVSHWKDGWKEIVKNWSDKITILSDGSRERLLLPADNGQVYILAHKLISESKFYCAQFDMEDVAYYRHHSYGYLYRLPINLAFDIFRHFVIAFGGTFLTSVPKGKIHRYYGPSTSYPQWFWIDEENKRHHKIIHDSLSQTYRNQEMNDECSSDRWQIVQAQGIQLNGELLPMHYIDAVLQQLRKYQTAQMIEHHFHRPDGKALAQRLSQMLEYRKMRYHTTTTTTVEVTDGRDSWFLVSLPLPLPKQNSTTGEQKMMSEREVAKRFSLKEEDWSAARKYFSTKMSGLEKLNPADLHFVISCFLDAEYDCKETLDKVNLLAKIDPTTNISCEFPTADDDFSSFDPLRLRGLLAETVLSKKLRGHALGKEEIFTGGFAAVAPLALAEIVAQYLPVNILNT